MTFSTITRSALSMLVGASALIGISASSASAGDYSRWGHRHHHCRQVCKGHLHWRHGHQQCHGHWVTVCR